MYCEEWDNDMDIVSERALDGLSITNLDFDHGSFTSKDIASPKAQHVLASVLFSKTVHDMEVKFDITIRKKTIFDCLHVIHAQDFLLGILLLV